MDRVFLHGLERTLSVGIYDHERTNPQRVRFDLDVTLALISGPDSTIDSVYNYEFLTHAIDTISGGCHIDLLETLANKIMDRLFDHPAVSQIGLRIAKLDVIPGASLGVHLHRTRADMKASR